MESLEEGLYSSVSLVSTTELETQLNSLREEAKALRQALETEGQSSAQLKVRLERLESITSSLERELSWRNVAKSQGIWKSKRCSHAVTGTCDAWHINEPDKLGIPSEAVIETEGRKRVSVTKFPELCIVCPLYEPLRS